jgi:hypothetical protein
MRWLAACAAIMLLSVGCAHQAAQTAPAAGEAGLPAGNGCIGQSLDACLAGLKASMTIDPNLLAASVARRRQVDVNGKPLAHASVPLSGAVPGSLQRLTMVLYLSSDDRVTGAEFGLWADPAVTKTEDGYDRTGLFEGVSRLLGNSCAEFGKLPLYRFFENSVKPRIASQLTKTGSGLAIHNTIVSRAEKLPYCGVQFSYGRLLKWDGSDIKTARNMSGLWLIRLDAS